MGSLFSFNIGRTFVRGLRISAAEPQEKYQYQSKMNTPSPNLI